MKVIERIYQYIDSIKVKPAVFEKKVGLSNGYLSKQYHRQADIGESILVSILENCPEINPVWLLTGEGHMLKEKMDLTTPVNDPIIHYLEKKLEEKEKKIEEQATLIGMLTKEIDHLKERESGGKYLGQFSDADSVNVL